MELQAWVFTFGVKYRQDPHPDMIENVTPHPDGWVTVMALDEDAARIEMYKHVENRWAFCYPLDRFDDSWYPDGELIRIEANDEAGRYSF